MATVRVHKLPRNAHRQRIHLRVRTRVAGTPERPRLCVFRSLNHIYAQVIDDRTGRTLAARGPQSRSPMFPWPGPSYELQSGW